MLPVLQEPECLRLKKKKKSLWCPARTAELVQVTEWPGEAGQDSAAIPEASSCSSGCPFCFLWAQHTVLCFEKWLFSVQCFSVPPGTLRKRRVPTERCRKPPGARVIRSVPASTHWMPHLVKWQQDHSSSNAAARQASVAGQQLGSSPHQANSAMEDLRGFKQNKKG